MTLRDQKKWELVQFCQELIRCKSYSGEEREAAGVLCEKMRELGYHEVETDCYGNVLGCIHGKKPGKNILFDGHIDTVKAEDEKAWTYPPFEAQIHGGKIYGRGASDMKAAVACFTLACAWYARECDFAFEGNIYVAGVVHEECFEGVAAGKVSEKAKPDYVVIGEASNCNIKIGQRGRAELKLEAFGIPAHSASPEKGVNAVYAIMDLIQKIQKVPLPIHPILGEGILELTDIQSKPYPGASVVPSYCAATYDRRLLPGETRERVLAPLRDFLAREMGTDPKLKAKISYAVGREKCYTGETISGERFFPGWLMDGKDETLEKVCKVLKKMQLYPEISTYHFCTNGSHYAGEKGIWTIGVGPSDESLAHIIDEYVEISELEKAGNMYYGILCALCGTSCQG